jgi:hypothetical protein
LSWNWIAFMPPATVGTATTSWPIDASPLRTLSGMVCSTSSALPSVQTPRRFHRLLQAHSLIDQIDQIDQRRQRAWKDPLSAGQAQRIDELAMAQRRVVAGLPRPTFCRRQ